MHTGLRLGLCVVVGLPCATQCGEATDPEFGGRDDAGFSVERDSGVNDAWVTASDVEQPSVRDGAFGSVDVVGEEGGVRAIEEIVFPDVTCPPGTMFETDEIAVCVDLRNEESFPGPCSLTSKVASVTGNDAWFEYQSCDYTYVDGRRLSSTCYTIAQSASDTLEGLCPGAQCRQDVGDNIIWYSTDLVYNDQGELTEVEWGFTSDFWQDESNQLDLLTNTLVSCEAESPCTTTVESDAHERELIAIAMNWFPMPAPNPFEARGEEPCTEIGSVEEGKVVRQCGDSIHEYRFHDGGQLMAYRVTTVGGASYCASCYRYGDWYLYDKGGNLRYVVETDQGRTPSYVDGGPGEVTVLREYTHGCWQ